jgi:hypothetical protein
MANQFELRIRAVLDLPEEEPREEAERKLCALFSNISNMAAARGLFTDIMPVINDITIEINVLPILRRRLLSGADDL